MSSSTTQTSTANGRDESREHTPPTPNYGLRALETMLEISNLVGSDLRLDEILNRIVHITASTLEAEIGSIYLFNDDRTRLVMRSTVGFEPELIGEAGFDAGEGIPGWVAEHGQIVALADAAEDPRYVPLPSELERDLHAYLCAPLRIKDDIIGVMTIRRHLIRPFEREETTLYATICKQVANVIEKARMYYARMEAEKLAAVAVSISGIAHYTKNVLLSMRGGEYLIDNGFKSGNDHQAREGWKILRRANRKITQLVENMLNYYREKQLNFRPIELNSLILEILENLEDRALVRKVTLSPDLDLRLENVELDSDAIQDVLINLITNAIDAIPEDIGDGLVRVQTRLDSDKGEVIIGVIDNGFGIEHEHQEKVFNLFFSTKGRAGTGIGLAASKRLILDHDGTIDFETEPGHGTSFWARLPLRQTKI